MVTIPDRLPFIQSIRPSWYQYKVAELAMLRLDVVHPEISGNKWYKLKENVRHCLANNYNSILTFGGAYSNHLAATAACAEYFNLNSIGIVKGKYVSENLTPTLLKCRSLGMQLEFVSNEEYRKKADELYFKELKEKYNNPFVIPEGGSNDLGRQGAASIVGYIPSGYTHVALSVGTGTTLVGIVNNIQGGIKVLGYAPMKGGGYLNDELSGLISSGINYRIVSSAQTAGFGKWNDELISFMNDFYMSNNIPLDVVYTAKMMYFLKEQLEDGMFSGSDKILCIHTGGLQGNNSVAHKLVY